MKTKKYVKFTQEQLMDFTISGIHAIAGGMIAKALAPVNERLAALEVENKHLRDALAELKDEDAGPAALAAQMTARYASLS